MANENGYIKLFSKFQHWGWYSDSKSVHLFIHLLINANFKDGWFMCEQIKRGELATSVNSLSERTGLTHKEVRTRLKNFEKTGEIGKRTGNRFTVITICKYDSYQHNPNDKGKPTGKQRANEGQTKGKQRATIEEEKKKRRIDEKSESSAHPIQKFISKNYPDLDSMEEPLTFEQAELIERRYSPPGIKETIRAMNNKWHTNTKQLRSTYDTIANWMPEKYKKPTL